MCAEFCKVEIIAQFIADFILVVIIAFHEELSDTLVVAAADIIRNLLIIITGG